MASVASTASTFANSYGRDLDAARLLYNSQASGVSEAYVMDGLKMEAMMEDEATAAKLKQMKKATAPKRTRQPKMTNRSTKSKARPGLRKGKWTEEESRYAGQLTSYFKEGLLPIERGTMLRLYLSQKLNCEPMRITKKFTGGECIGKQVFRPATPTPDSRVRMMQAQLELVALEAAFIKRLKENREETPAAIEELEANAASSALVTSNMHAAFDRSGQYRLDRNEYRLDQAHSGQGDVDDAGAVGLLLDFFYKANRNDKENDGKKASAHNPQPARPSSMPSSLSSSPIKKEVVESDENENENKDPVENSPTKRIRALSISNFPNDPAAAKRSRVGSFTVCA